MSRLVDEMFITSRNLRNAGQIRKTRSAVSRFKVILIRFVFGLDVYRNATAIVFPSFSKIRVVQRSFGSWFHISRRSPSSSSKSTRIVVPVPEQ